MEDDHRQRPESPPSSSYPPTVNLVSPVRQPTSASATSPSLFQPPAADDMDVMLLHEDLPELVRLAARLQEATATKTTSTTTETTTAASTTTTTVTAPMAVVRMQQALLSQPGETIPRGRYPMVDAMLKDAMEQLQESLESLTVAKTPPEAVATPTKPSHKRKPTDAPIAVKYAKAQTDALMQWMIDHQDNPFPTPQDLEHLSQTTGLTRTQVNNWATNVRKRNLKATCENGKKPHHFIDFLFHRRDREAKATKEQQHSHCRDSMSGGCATTTFRSGGPGGVPRGIMYSSQQQQQQQQRRRQQQLGRRTQHRLPSSPFQPHHVVDLTQEPTHRRTPSFNAAVPHTVSPSWSLTSVFDEVDEAMFGSGFNDSRCENPSPRQQPSVAVQQQSRDSFGSVPSFDDEPYALESVHQPVHPMETPATPTALERLHSGSIESLDDIELDKLVKELDGMNDIL